MTALIATTSAPQRTLLDAGQACIEYYVQGTGPLVVLLPSLGRGAEDFDAVRPLWGRGFHRFRGAAGSRPGRRSRALLDFEKRLHSSN